jgi:Icc-related predicted phosphoesterase
MINEENAMEKLILSGALEFAGLDSKTGEVLYSFTNKIKEVMPELYKQHINHVNQEILKLWEYGFVNINFLEDNPQVTLTEKAFDNRALEEIPSEMVWGLEEIKRLILGRNL